MCYLETLIVIPKRRSLSQTFVQPGCRSYARTRRATSCRCARETCSFALLGQRQPNSIVDAWRVPPALKFQKKIRTASNLGRQRLFSISEGSLPPTGVLPRCKILDLPGQWERTAEDRTGLHPEEIARVRTLEGYDEQLFHAQEWSEGKSACVAVRGQGWGLAVAAATTSAASALQAERKAFSLARLFPQLP